MFFRRGLGLIIAVVLLFSIGSMVTRNAFRSGWQQGYLTAKVDSIESATAEDGAAAAVPFPSGPRGFGHHGIGYGHGGFGFFGFLAVFFLGERLNASRVGVVVMGILGAMIIIRPGIAAFDPASMLVLAAAFGYAISLIATKKLIATESAFAIIVWMNIMQFPMGLIGSDPLFVTRLGLADIPTAIGIGATGLASHYCLSNAFRSGDASIVVPIDFLRIPLIAVIGWWIYGEKIDVWVFTGAGLIIAGVLWNLHHEAGRARAA